MTPVGSAVTTRANYSLWDTALLTELTSATCVLRSAPRPRPESTRGAPRAPRNTSALLQSGPRTLTQRSITGFCIHGRANAQTAPRSRRRMRPLRMASITTHISQRRGRRGSAPEPTPFQNSPERSEGAQRPKRVRSKARASRPPSSAMTSLPPRRRGRSGGRWCPLVPAAGHTTRRPDHVGRDPRTFESA
jgi:hypothetical protein